jgi:hypothetical protein
MNNSLIIGTVVILAIVFLIGSDCTFKEGATGGAGPSDEEKKKCAAAANALCTKNGCRGVDTRDAWRNGKYDNDASLPSGCFVQTNDSAAIVTQGKEKATYWVGINANKTRGPKDNINPKAVDGDYLHVPPLAPTAPSAPSSSIGTPSASSGGVECKTITNTNAEKCAAMASTNNQLAAVKKLELDECVKLGPSWTSAVTGHYEGPACSNPKTGTSCCLGNDCAGIKKCVLPTLPTKPNLPPPITGKELVQVCKGAPFPAQKGLSLAQRQASLLNTNKKLMDLSNKIYSCIEKVYAKRVKLGTYSTKQRQNMNQQLAQYEKVRKELLKHQTEQTSLQAMLTDKELQTSSTSMHYMVWFILAISGAVIALRQLSR